MQSFSTNTDSNEMWTQMKPLVRTLQYFGGYPIKIKTFQNSRKNNSKSIKIQDESLQQNCAESENVYETTIFKWTQVGAWYSYIVHAIKIFFVLTYLCNIGLGISYPVKLLSFGPELETFFGSNGSSYDGKEFACTAFLNIVKTIFIFWNTEEFVRWLNNWRYFERDFRNCFKGRVHNSEIASFTMEVGISLFLNRVLLFYLALPAVLATLMLCVYVLPKFVCHVEVVSVACMIVVSIATSGHLLMEDAKVFIILKAQVLAYEQILAGIKESTQSGSLMISASEVIGWRGLVKKVREQTTLSSGYLKSQEMMLVAETIMSCSLGVSYVLKFVSQNALNSMTNTLLMPILGNSYSCLTNFLRLYLKVVLAEKISAVERLLAAEVIQMDSTTQDVATKTELKFLYSQISQNPVCVNFGNYFKLDKKLLLNVVVQVVTYLIVIMQFQSNK